MITSQKTCYNCKQIIDGFIDYWVMINNKFNNKVVTAPTCSEYCMDKFCATINDHVTFSNATKVYIDRHVPEQHDDPFE